VAVLAPLVVLAVAAWALWPGSPTPGRVTPHLDSLAEDCSDARVVLLGNSKTRSDLNPRELEAFLGLPRGAVAALTLHGSSAPAWYAVAKNLVRGAGCRPAVLVAYGSIDKLLAGDVSPDERVRLLAPVMSDHEPELVAKLGGGSAPGGWLQARQAAAGQREALLQGAAALPVGLLYARPADLGPVEHGRAVLDAAWDRVFTGSVGAVEVPSAVLPVQAAARPGETRRPAGPAETFLPELAAEAEAMGATLVLAWAPMRDEAQERATVAVPGLVQGSRALATELGAVFLDLRSDSLPADAWEDERHMSAMGSTRTTRALAVALGERGLIPDAPASLTNAEPVWLLERPRRFEGAPPSVALGRPAPVSGGGASAAVQPPLPLGDQHCLEHEVWSCCSPLRVFEDGQPLPEPNVAPQLVGSLGAGRYTHLGDRVLLSSSDGTPSSDHRYEARLAADRWCGALWLYPGDRLVISGIDDDARGGTLELLVRGFGPAPWPLRIGLRADGAPGSQHSIELEPGVDGLHHVELGTSLPAGPLELVVHSDGAEGYALLTHLALLP